MTQEDTQQEKEEGRRRRVGGRMRYSAHATHLIAGAGMGQGATCVPGKTVWSRGRREGYFIQGVAVVVDYDSIMIMLHALATNVIAALSDFNCSRN